MSIFITIVLLNLIKCRFHLCYCGYTILRKVSLATIGVCVFSALTSVGALFYFRSFYEKEIYK